MDLADIHVGQKIAAIATKTIDIGCFIMDMANYRTTSILATFAMFSSPEVDAST